MIAKSYFGEGALLDMQRILENFINALEFLPQPPANPYDDFRITHHATLVDLGKYEIVSLDYYPGRIILRSTGGFTLNYDTIPKVALKE
jgi:hypothetical protein